MASPAHVGVVDSFRCGECRIPTVIRPVESACQNPSSSKIDQVNDVWGVARPHEDRWPESALTLAGHCVRRAVIDYLGEDFRRTAAAVFSPPVLERELRLNLTARNALRALRTLERTLEVEYAILVASLRFEGESWSEIGKVLGMSKQAAQSRYGKIATEIVRVCAAGTASQVLEAVLPDAGVPESRTHELASVLQAHYDGSAHRGWSFDHPYPEGGDYLDRSFTDADAFRFDDDFPDETDDQGGRVAVEPRSDPATEFDVDDLPF